MNDSSYEPNALPADTQERILLDHAFGGKKRGFATFLICCALLIAAFAVSALWMHGSGESWLGKETPAGDEAHTEGGAHGEEDMQAPIIEGDEIPQGATAILDRDLSYPALGRDYIQNETIYTPCVEELLKYPIGAPGPTEQGPLVLILHTHTGESFLPAGSRYVQGALGDATYSRDEAQNILSVGATLCEELNSRGIGAVHCTTVHDDPTVGGAYARAYESVQSYLATYPTIRYVIDLHRDAIVTSSGEIVRALAADGETAQVMAVVGTSGNGTVFAQGWESNLALALRLREALNKNGAAVCRPVSLRNASFNQELAPFSLLLEIGTAANSPKEAKRAAVQVGEALADLIYAR